MKWAKQMKILLILGILILVGFHIKAIVKILMQEPHQVETEKELNTIQLNQQKWEKEGIRVFLEDEYEPEEAKKIMTYLEEEFGKRYGEQYTEMIYGGKLGGKNWGDFSRCVWDISLKISRVSVDAGFARQTFSEWLLGY